MLLFGSVELFIRPYDIGGRGGGVSLAPSVLESVDFKLSRTPGVESAILEVRGTRLSDLGRLAPTDGQLRWGDARPFR